MGKRNNNVSFYGNKNIKNILREFAKYHVLTKYQNVLKTYFLTTQIDLTK